MKYPYVRQALLAVALVALLVLVGACGTQIFDRMNLMDELRYTVEDQVYGVVESGVGESHFEMSLERRIPSGTISQDDVDAIEAVGGITLVDVPGARFPLTGVTLQPNAGEQGSGFVVLVFDLTDAEAPAEQTWTLEWPGHDPQIVYTKPLGAGE